MNSIFFKNIAYFNIFDDIDVYDKKISKYIHENDYCFFENFNIWNDIVNDHIKPQKKFKKCKKIDDNKYYRLVDEVITVKRKDLLCFYGCKYPKDDFNINVSSYVYINQSYKLDCDIFHFRCYNRSNAIIYDDVYFHINKLSKIPKESTPFLEENFSIPINNKRYDVHIYVIDSLSYYHALRALPKTRKYLKENFNGVEMEYLNAIGGSSRLNAYGFLLNKQNMDVDDFFSYEKTKKNDFGDSDSCEVALDNQTFIQEYYKKMGYVKLSAEDYEPGGIFSYVNCTGFKKEPPHHTLKPFQILSKQIELGKVIENKFKRKCYHHGFHIIDYMSDFLQKYENNLKMTLIWHSNLLHDEINPIFTADETFYKSITKRNKKKKFVSLITPLKLNRFL
uniref:DNA-directed DNA polymerase n=1 Tax=Strongyloides papillosus TaxID=174720 RepID=A0A0N5BJS6_STREA